MYKRRVARLTATNLYKIVVMYFICAELSSDGGAEVGFPVVN